MRKLLVLVSVISLAFLGSAELDLREANVMEVERQGDRFSVTLYHDDSGEEGYANWWQVETLEGERLGRRELLHSHGTRNFTRSETIEVPDEASKIVIRGHDQTHGYGGKAVIYKLETGEARTVDQGEEPRDFGTDQSSEPKLEEEEEPEDEEVGNTGEKSRKGDTEAENLIGKIFRFFESLL